MDDKLMDTSRIHLCFVGSMLGRNAGYITTQGQISADLFAAEDGFEVISVSAQLNRARRLADIILTISRNRKKIDFLILEVYSGLSIVIADVSGWLCRRFGITLIAVLHGGNLPVFAKRYPKWTRRVLKRSNALVAPSPFLAREMGDLGLPIRVIPNVVELEAYSYKLRQKIMPKLIWMRSFHPAYNPQMAVEVLSLVRKKVSEATLVMAGVDKGLELATKKIAVDVGLKEAIRFPGFLDMKAKMGEFSCADIYLNTNRIDNMPVSIIEALAMGLPVIATAVGGIPDLLKHCESGLLVASEDAEAMAESVVKLLEDAELTERLSRNGRRTAEKSAWQSVLNLWKELFADLDELAKGRAGNNL